MDRETRLALNRVAREQLKLRLLADIAQDLAVCQMEGWSHWEYIDELIALLRSLRQRSNDDGTEG